MLKSKIFGVDSDTPGMKYLYMTAIVPPTQLATKIRDLQHEFSDKYGSAAALRPPVHITITPPHHLEEQEVTAFMQSVKNLPNRNSYGISIDGFAFFKRNRVLFLRVLQNETLAKIQTNLSKLLNVSENRPYRPHITIGYRDISQSTFEEIVRDYQSRPFKATFVVSEIQLWKHEDKRWKTIATF